jgi:hypothetical protein
MQPQHELAPRRGTDAVRDILDIVDDLDDPTEDDDESDDEEGDDEESDEEEVE